MYFYKCFLTEFLDLLQDQMLVLLVCYVVLRSPAGRKIMLLNSFPKFLERKKLFQTTGFLQIGSIYCFLARTGKVHLGDVWEILSIAGWGGSLWGKLAWGANGRTHHLLTTTAKSRQEELSTESFIHVYKVLTARFSNGQTQDVFLIHFVGAVEMSKCLSSTKLLKMLKTEKWSVK